MHERSLQQTNDHINQIEQQIFSIESISINQTTLDAMEKAGKAMKDIHGNLTIDRVDATMYVQLIYRPAPSHLNRWHQAPILLTFSSSQGQTPRTARPR